MNVSAFLPWSSGRCGRGASGRRRLIIGTGWRYSRGRLVGVVLTVIAVLFTAGTIVPSANAGSSLEIVVLSNRADLISGGDALVEVLPSSADSSKIRVDVDGRDVTSAFARRPNGRFMGLVTGLRKGENVLTARGQGGASRITITNHPIGGPIFSGPQVRPWICETEKVGLGPAKDMQCNAPTKVGYFYKSSDPAKTGFQPYDPETPPSDVATTRTDQGTMVPFIVRRETGTANRGIYQIALLHDPNQPVRPWAPQQGWNHKLYYLFEGGAAPNHRQGTPPDVMGRSYVQNHALSRGWAVATASLNRFGQNTNVVTSAETVAMVKERVVEEFGEIRYTMSAGCSGGSLQQYVIADAYPGLLDGIQPSCSHPDFFTVNTEATDCSLLQRVFNEASPHLWSVAAQRTAVMGHMGPATCAGWAAVFFRIWMDPRMGCTELGIASEQLEPDWVYDPETNATGARCTIQDYQVAQFGRRPSDAWGNVERRIGEGFANRPYDNVGVQYGLRALESGLITSEQFVDLNEKIGGYDIDVNWHRERIAADPYALEAAYRTATITHGSNLAKVPIIDLRGTENYSFHTDVKSWVARARLDQANGHHDNQLIWVSAPTAPAPSADSARESFEVLDTWLSKIEADASTDSLEAKVVNNKPAGAVDACWIEGRKITDQATCRAAFPYFGLPRIAAGSPLADNIFKCQLKPLTRGDYDVAFTEEQWNRLHKVFSAGVCDYSKPGVGQQPAVPWLTFASGPGGEPLGPAPRSAVFKGVQQ